MSDGSTTQNQSDVTPLFGACRLQDLEALRRHVALAKKQRDATFLVLRDIEDEHRVTDTASPSATKKSPGVNVAEGDLLRVALERGGARPRKDLVEVTAQQAVRVLGRRSDALQRDPLPFDDGALACLVVAVAQRLRRDGPIRDIARLCRISTPPLSRMITSAQCCRSTLPTSRSATATMFG